MLHFFIRFLGQKHTFYNFCAQKRPFCANRAFFRQKKTSDFFHIVLHSEQISASQALWLKSLSEIKFFKKTRFEVKNAHFVSKTLKFFQIFTFSPKKSPNLINPIDLLVWIKFGVYWVTKRHIIGV